MSLICLLEFLKHVLRLDRMYVYGHEICLTQRQLSGPTPVSSVKVSYGSLEAEWVKTQNTKVAHQGVSQGLHGRISKIRLQWPSFSQKTENWSWRPSSSEFRVLDLKLVLIEAESGNLQNMKVLGLFVNYNFHEESIFKFLIDFKL